MRKQLIIVLGLCVTLTLSGCNTYHFGNDNNSSGGRASGKVDPRLANNDDVGFFSKSGITACAGGAAIGALSCALSNSSNKGLCMAAAAIAGCGLGIGANAYLDSQRKQYSNTEQRLNAMIADITKENNRLQSASNTAKSVITDNKRTLTRINQDIKNNTLNKSNAEQELKSIDANINSLNTTLLDIKKREKAWVDISSQSKSEGIKTAQLDKEIKTMRSQIDSLQEELDSLYSQRSAIRLS